MAQMSLRNQSVIGYAIVSFESLQFIKEFSVLELDTLYSDGHVLISTKLVLNLRREYLKYKSAKT